MHLIGIKIMLLFPYDIISGYQGGIPPGVGWIGPGFGSGYY